MVDVNRGAAGYHLESLPDGQQVLVNNQNGNVAVTDPYTGQIVREVPKAQVIAERGATAPAAVGIGGTGQKPGGPLVTPKPNTISTPGTTTPSATISPAGGAAYPRGVTNPGGGLPPYTPPGSTAPTASTTDTSQTSPSGAPSGRPAPGAAGYDLWAMNDMLRSNGYNDWQVTGVTPIQQVDSQKNPDYPDLSDQPTLQTPKNEYIINIRNPSTNEIKTLTFSKVFQNPDGTYTDKDNGSGYGYQLGNVTDQQKADPSKVGHTGQMTIGNQLWGTNASTGAFEQIPGAPTIPTAWANAKQVPQADGSQVWYGTDPADGKLKPIPDMPVIPKEASSWGDVRQIDNGQGQMVWYGTDPADKVLKPIPNMPTTAKPPTGPSSITGQNNVTYIQKPDGTYAPAPGIPDPNPPKGTPQVKLGTDGYLYRQISRGDGTFDPDTTFDPVPFTDAAKQARANIGATHPAGSPGTKVINGKVYHVTYRGDSQDSYDVDTSQPATPMPGADTPTSIATGTDQPKIAQRAPDGSIQWVDNQNYQPTDPAQRVSQLQSQASAKLSELQSKIGTGGYTADQAQQEFDDWWNSNVEPAKQEIQQAQQQKQIDTQLKINAEQRAQEEQQRTNYATALSAGQNAVDAAKAQMPYMVGPGFGKALNQIAGAFSSGKAPGNLDLGSAVTFQMPDLNQLAMQATNQALAHLSPTAAQGMNAQTGTQATPGLPQQAPNYDYTQSLQRNKYQVPGTTTTVQPDGTVQIQSGQPQTGSQMPGMYTNPAQYQGPGLATAPTTSSVPAIQPVGPAPTVPPGMYNPWYQQQYPPIAPASAGVLPQQNNLSEALPPYQLT